ncbi:hypothetical protein DCO48_08655 [Pseudomonas sp. SDI]|uniref:hypothetical protein n=1 Tax=Pseudomonas sp. SDI TaxID=2170734 RepID=UPI000DE5C773|nr:hypothetical protein [Pseudomonas sp. SDI]PWB33718.1 hypothetical protein DCO48_08655 [Pseudomonas sp. SDI]
MKPLTFSLLSCLLLGSAAHASSEQAWAEHEKSLSRACVAASQLKDAKPLGKPAEFDDRVGYSALLIQGRYPEKHMNNRKGTELCLFDKQRQAAFVTEWTPARP